MMSRKPKILVVGSFVMDLIASTTRFPQSGESIIGFDFSTAPGGKGANQAVQAAYLGADVSMVGKVGNDDFGKILRESIGASGVDCSRVAVSQTRPSAVGNIQLEVTESGTANRILVVPGANMDITPSDVAFLENDIKEYDMVILQLEIPMEINELVAEYAHKNGVAVMLNSAPSAPLSDKLLSCLTYISPNEHEASDLTGIKITDDETAQKAAKALREKGVKNVLITMGSRGAAFYDGEEFFISESVDYGPVLDPTAAGDSFVGAFCTATCAGAAPKDALLFANHTAAITVAGMGAQPSLPKLSKVLEFMNKNGFNTEKYEILK